MLDRLSRVQIRSVIRWEQDLANRLRERCTFSPSGQKNFEEPLSFAEEVGSYRLRTIAQREPHHAAAVRGLAGQVPLRADTKLVIAVPAFVRERSVERSLGSYLDSAQDLSTTELLLFVNASVKDCTEKDFRRHLSRIRRDVARVRARSASFRVHVIELHAQLALSMGRVRAILHDVLVEAAVQSGVCDLAVLFNDADQLAIAPGTLSRVKASFADNPLLDLICMPVSHGYTADGTNLLGANLPLAPELLLGVRYNHSAWLATKFDQAPLEWLLESDGGCFAARLSSLCAIDGFDVNRAQGEDNAVAMKLKALRRIADRAVGTGGRAPPHLGFDADSEVVSNPRRLLNAILHGRTANQAWHWQPFERNQGCDFSVPQMLARYARQPGALQVADLMGLEPSAPTDRVLSSVLANLFLAPFRNPLVRTKVGYIQVASRFGLGIRRISLDESGRVSGLTLDLDRSPIFELLRRWAGSAAP